MREMDATLGSERLKVVCTWCGEVIRAASKPAQRMCQPCFARMMNEHTRAQRLRAGWGDASDR